MNITITGNLGGGKTSVCRELKKSGFTVVSAGDIFRDIAQEKGMTVIQLNEAAKLDRSIDDLLDSRSMELGRKLDNAVFDSRLAWHFVEKSFKVFLLVNTDEAAKRVFAGDQRSAEAYQNVKEAADGLETRAKMEQARFLELYGIDYYDGSNYDLIIESSCASPKEIAQEIQRNFALYQEQPFSTKVEMNLKCLYPTKKFADIDQSMLEQYYQEERSDSPSLCSKAAPVITVKNGYNYILHGHHHVFAAAAAGKVFAAIKNIQNINLDAAEQEAVTVASGHDLSEYEKAGKFHYQVYPAAVPERAGYTLDISGCR